MNLECVLRTHSHARNITTGLMTFAPGAVLARRLHTFNKSIALPQGRAGKPAEAWSA
jgi:hypothetical protein